MKLMCEVAGCDSELTEGTGSKGGPMLCPGCRTSSYYWKKQSIGHMRHRHEALKLYSARLEYYNPKVTEIKNKAKKAVIAAKKKAAEATALH
jgi:hypothetical protein